MRQGKVRIFAKHSSKKAKIRRKKKIKGKEKNGSKERV